MPPHHRAIVITGVSTGIGHAAARLAAQNGVHVFGSVRQPEAAATLAAELGTAFTPLLFDVRDDEAVAAAASHVRAALGGRRLAGLVNNAGIAHPGPLALQPAAAFREQIDVNLVAPFLVTQAFLPLLGTDPALTGPPGRIVNISSLAGIAAVPFVGAYVATKHGIEGYSKTLAIELEPFGIAVIVVAPGTIATPIWSKVDHAFLARFDTTPYAAALGRFRDDAQNNARTGLSPDRAASEIWTALTARQPQARYPAANAGLAQRALARLLRRR